MSNHKAIVAKITSIEEIPGADHIHLAKVLGESVVVSKEWGVGFEGILFPVDVQLSEQFCYENNLFRKKEKNKDNTKSGFFEDNRRVRAQPFLKVRSEGFFTHKDSLKYTGADVDSLKLGDSFSEINGVSVCQKYISEATKVAKNNSSIKSAKKTYAPLFEKHVDSAQFRHYAESIPAGSLISFHAKVHGCFTAKTRIRMYDGTVKPISKVVVGDEVLGFDENGNFQKSKVLATFDNGRGGDWLEITTSRASHFNSSQNITSQDEKLVVTANHEFYLGDGKWVRAGDLVEGGFVKKAIKSYVPSEEQIAAIVGMHLGDGYMSRSGNMQFCHKLDHEDYLGWKIGLMSPERLDKKIYKTSGYGSKVVFNLVSANRYYTTLFNGVGNNEVTDWMVEAATPLTLAIIYMDDGSLQHNSFQQDRAALACCSINDKDIDKFISIFTKFDINPCHYVDKLGYNRLRFNRDEAIKLWRLIAPYVPAVMKYKLPKEFRDVPTKDIERGYYGYFNTNCLIKSIKKVDADFKRYDIQTETSNYVAGNILVHNSSARMSHTLVNKTLPKWKQWVNKLFPVFPTQEWDYVVGTRNVIIMDDKKEGFHGSEKFRFDVAEAIKPYIEKGMTIYGEIAGFANGKPIMPRHSIEALKDKRYTKKYGKEITYTYGCKEHELRFHVYRITYLNHEGKNIDFTQKQVEKWCSDRGILCTHEVHPQIVYDGDVDKLRELVHNLTERPDLLTEDYIDPSHISEGIILRVDYGDHTPSFYKSKSYAFRVMEGICEVVDTEDAS